MIYRILLTPIYLILLIASVAVNAVLRLSAWLFYLLGGLCLLTTACCYYMQLESAAGLHHMIICSGILLLLPQAAEIISAVLTVATEIIGDRIKGI